MRPYGIPFALAVLLYAAPLAQAVDWAPITEEELNIKQPKLDPDADAEAIFWEAWIADQSQGDMVQNVRTHYVRVKIFTERGVESQSTVDLSSVTGSPYAVRIHDLRGRTIKPDGSIRELEKAAVFERTTVKASGTRVRTRSFSMPNVEVGDIIEYQWREITDNLVTSYDRLYFDRDVPTWRITYHIRPHPRASSLGLTMQSQSFNVQHSGFKKGVQDFWDVTVENAPAYKEEAYMPPEDEVRSWVLLFYTKGSKADAERFWKDYGKEVHQELSVLSKPDGAVKKKALELTAGASTDEEKLEKILEFCRREIRNPYHDRSGVSAEERQKIKENKNAGETLKNMQGSGEDITMLFAALLQGAGLDGRPALVARRDGRFFNVNFLDPYFLRDAVVAVPINGELRYFDLSYPYVEAC